MSSRYESKRQLTRADVRELLDQSQKRHRITREQWWRDQRNDQHRRVREMIDGWAEEDR